jgi:hypothetical protein
LGKEHYPKLTSIDFSEDGKSITLNLKVEPNAQYQIQLKAGYRSEDGVPIKPFLIGFKTGGK